MRVPVPVRTQHELTLHIDVCLVPEVAFDPTKLAKYVAQCLKARARCVICMAEVRLASGGTTEAVGG